MDPLLETIELAAVCDPWYAAIYRYAKYSDERLASEDTGNLNILCSCGLPNAEDLGDCFAKFDQWTLRVQEFTEQNAYKFHKNPAYYEHSFAKYQMMAIATESHHNQGISYYWPADQGDYDGTDSRNLFIHGILTKHGVTCCNMPVLQLAIGRRLGYPLYLRKAHRHYYARWDEPGGESFNIECTTGFAAPADEFYRQGRMECPDEEVEKGCYLRNLTPREELAQFLLERHNCLKDHMRLEEAHQALYFAHQLFPQNGIISDQLRFYIPYLSHVLKDAKAKQGIRDYDLSQVDLEKIRLPEPKGDWNDVLLRDASDNIQRIVRNRGKRAALNDKTERMLAIVNGRPHDHLFASLGRFDPIPIANNRKEQSNAEPHSRKIPRRRRPK